MDYKEVLETARKVLAPKCRVCPVCDGRACRGEVPGVGGKGTGATFVRNVAALEEVKLVLDTLYADRGQDTSCEFFGRTFAMPVFAAPIGGMKLNYASDLGEGANGERVVKGAHAAGSAAFTGDSPDEAFYGPLEAIKALDGWGVPTIKPWAMKQALARMADAVAADAMAVAMDVDAAGLVNVKLRGESVYPKSVADLRVLVEAAGKIPFIVKGVMSAKGALKALEAGCYGIVVSNHGGRVLDHAQSTAEVLPEIAQAVNGRMKIFVDGGVRSGVDVFKMLALGADAVLIGRPVTMSAFGGGAEGVEIYLKKIQSELAGTMLMTGAAALAEIGRDMVRVPAYF